MRVKPSKATENMSFREAIGTSAKNGIREHVKASRPTVDCHMAGISIAAAAEHAAFHQCLGGEPRVMAFDDLRVPRLLGD
jgi:hypothetical protein